jgi:hypothetical protein
VNYYIALIITTFFCLFTFLYSSIKKIKLDKIAKLALIEPIIYIFLLLKATLKCIYSVYSCTPSVALISLSTHIMQIIDIHPKSPFQKKVFFSYDELIQGGSGMFPHSVLAI